MDSNEDPAKFPCERACLCVLCGLPAAGKSTVAQAVRYLAAQRGWRTTVISYDELIPDDAFHHRAVQEDDDDGADLLQTQTKWKLHRHAVLQCIEQLLLNPQTLSLPTTTCQVNSDAWRKCVDGACVSGTSAGSQTNLTQDRQPLLLLLDDNFYYPSMRYEVYQLARKYSLGFCQVYLQCSLDSCIRRNQGRFRPVPCEVIIEMARRIEPPNPQRNPWEQSSVSLDATDDLTEEAGQKLMKLISAAFDNPLSPVQDNTVQKEADRLSCANSVVHQADQACRRLVSLAMLSARENKIPPNHMKSLAAELNVSKTRFLHNLRKQVLQGLPVTPEESIDVERVVKRAVGVFHQDQKEVMARFLTKEML